MSRFDYVKYDEKAMALQGEILAMALGLEAALGALPDSRAKSLALTKLEEAYMWAGKAIRDDQLSRGAG